MTAEKAYIVETAEKICIPALEKALNNLALNKTYTVTDHVSVECSKLEELLRPLWGIAPLLKNKSYTVTVNGEKCDLAAAMRKAILAGCDESSPVCFSRYAENLRTVVFSNQMITEFASYCLAIVIAPEVLWDPYTKEEKQLIGEWIKKWAVNALENSWRNNHFWFPILSVIALEKMGIECGDVQSVIDDGFSVLDKMYISDGWYQDGEFGRFDYYLAWSHHVYPLLWSYLAKDTQFYDEERAATYKKRTVEFFDYYSHMFDADGSVPAFGRSLSYRFAQSAYFAAATFADCDIDYGMARNILVKNISYFMDNMIMPEDNVLPPGYMYDSAALVENYTSSGGAYWCAKTFLITALADDHPFWTAEEKPLPIEEGSYLINSPVDGINMVIDGNSHSGVTLFNNTSKYYNEKDGYCGRFNDMASYYSKFLYNSRSGFGISTIDNVSSDNTISLETPDGTMTSRRNGFTDHGYENGVLVSSHTPFANDKGTTIKSWVLPLGNGFHVRAHKIVLSQDYKVIEGGFSVGTFDDGYSIESTPEYVKYTDGRGKISAMHTVSETIFRHRISYHNPGMHILAPQSGYPTYVTNYLRPGTYRFASVFYFTTDEMAEKWPEIALEGNVLSVTYGDYSSKIVID